MMLSSRFNSLRQVQVGPRGPVALRSSTLRSSLIRKYSTENTESEVTELESMKQVNEFIDNENKLSVIDFYATWCGPCKALAPIFATLAKKIPEVQFGRVDVDKASEIAMEYRVTSMPTCIYFKDGEKVDTVVGADPQRIVSLIQKHSGINLLRR